jgi:hypothetical protein
MVALRLQYARCGVLVAVITKVAVFWDVIPFSLVGVYGLLEGPAAFQKTKLTQKVHCTSSAVLCNITLSKATRFLRPTFIRRTSGHSLVIFTAEFFYTHLKNVVSSPTALYYYYYYYYLLTCLPTYSMEQRRS